VNAQHTRQKGTTVNSHPATIAATIGFLLGGIVSTVNHALSFVAVVTAVLTGAARYYAILRGADKDQVERATAYGFFLGALLSALLLAFDRILMG
jgi:hypothetical protein